MGLPVLYQFRIRLEAQNGTTFMPWQDNPVTAEDLAEWREILHLPDHGRTQDDSLRRSATLQP